MKSLYERQPRDVGAARAGVFYARFGRQFDRELGFPHWRSVLQLPNVMNEPALEGPGATAVVIGIRAADLVGTMRDRYPDAVIWGLDTRESRTCVARPGAPLATAPWNPVREQSLENLDALLEDIPALNVIVVRQVLMHTMFKSTFLRQLSGKCKPGGVLIGSEFVQNACMSPAEYHDILRAAHLTNLSSKQSLLHEMKSAGWGVLRVQEHALSALAQDPSGHEFAATPRAHSRRDSAASLFERGVERIEAALREGKLDCVSFAAERKEVG